MATSTTDLLYQIIAYAIAHNIDVGEILAAVIGVAGSFLTAIVSLGVKYLRDLARSVQVLNVNMAKMLPEQQAHRSTLEVHTAQITDLDVRVRVIERLNHDEGENETPSH